MTEQPSPYRCETCHNIKCTHCAPGAASLPNRINNLWGFTALKGCASHSAFSAPPEGAATVPDSTRLIEMAKRAHTEWKNREERRGIYNEIDWCCGWMAGFLSVDKPDWVKAQAQAAREEVTE